MKPLDYPLLLDENVHPEVAAALRSRGKDVESVYTVGAIGAPDVRVLELATDAGRVVVTHDSDFGTLAVRAGQGLIGIVYIRPGHIRPEVVMETLDAVDALDISPAPPFIVVAERRGTDIRIRVRELPPTAAP